MKMNNVDCICFVLSEKNPRRYNLINFLLKGLLFEIIKKFKETSLKKILIKNNINCFFPDKLLFYNLEDENFSEIKKIISEDMKNLKIDKYYIFKWEVRNMGVKINEVLERIFEIEDRITELTDNFINYLENESYYLKLKSDVIEYTDYMIIKIDVPGIEPEDLKIFQKDNNLIVKGIKRKEYNDEKVNFIIAERRFGNFYNIFPISEDYDLNSIDIKMKNGVLTIKISRKDDITIIKKIEVE